MPFVIIGVAIVLGIFGIAFGYTSSFMLVAIVTGISLIIFLLGCQYMIHSGNCAEIIMMELLLGWSAWVGGGLLIGLWVGWFIHWLNIRVVFNG